MLLALEIQQRSHKPLLDMLTNVLELEVVLLLKLAVGGRQEHIDSREVVIEEVKGSVVANGERGDNRQNPFKFAEGNHDCVELSLEH